MTDNTTQQDIDAIKWAAIEADYRAGIKPLRHIASEHDITEGAIRKRAKKEEWERDLAERIKKRAEDLVRKESVRKEVRKTHCVPEKDVIEANARNQADLILSHRKDIPRYQKLASALMEEIEVQTGNKELFDQLAELLQAPDDKGMDKLNEIYRKVIGTPQRIDSFKKLAETYKILIGLERQAFGLSDNANGEADKPSSKQVTKDLTPQDAARAYAEMVKVK